MGVNFLSVFSCCYKMSSRNSIQDVLAKPSKTVNRLDGLAFCFRLFGMFEYIPPFSLDVLQLLLKICSPNLACLFFLIIELIHNMK